MKKVIFWFVIVFISVSLVFSLSVVSCKAEEIATTESPVVEEPAVEELVAEKTVLNVVSDAYHEEYLSVFAEKFKKEYSNIDPNIIVYDFMTVNEKQLLELSMKEGKFDVITSVPSWFSQYVGGGFLEPLDPYINDPNLTDSDIFDLDDFLPAVLDSYKADGKIYGLSIALFPNVMFYNEDLLIEYGIEVPKTLDEYLEAVKKLTLDLDNDGEIDIYGNVYNGVKGGVGAVGWNWFPYLFTFGGSILNDEGAPVINSPEAVKALEYYVELSKYAPAEAINYNWEQALEPMQEGYVAFSLTDFDAWRPFKEVEDITIKIAPFPAGPDGKSHTFLGNWGEHIAKNSPHKEEAWEWIKFITSKEVMNVYMEFGEIPCRSSSLQDKKLLEKYPEMGVAYEAMRYGKGLPKHQEYGQIEEAVVIAITEALTGKKTPKEALDNAQLKIEEIVQK